LRGPLIVLLLCLKLLSGVLVDDNPNDHMILSERDDVPVLQHVVSFNLDESASALPQVLQHVVILLVGELDDEVLGTKTFPWWQDKVAKLGIISVCWRRCIGTEIGAEIKLVELSFAWRQRLLPPLKVLHPH
jgi:hypothetical protein